MSAGTIDELKSRIKDVPVSEILSRYVHVVKKGTQTQAVCPFHDDHDPSLTINDQRGMWFCFVDNMGGDAIRFVMLYRKLEFLDALKDICDKLGWNFNDYHQEKKASPKVEMGKKLLTNGMKLFKKIAETGQYQPFQDFLKNRGLSEEIAKNYQLGYAPNGTVFFDYISSIKNEKERNFAISIAQELGMIKPSTFGNKSHYDTFRDRIIFPIWDHFGQVIGFTSRATQDDQKPKYLNSIDSFLFSKKDLLYGLHLAKNSIRERDQVILVEGNMDQVAMFKNGFENTVAIMGVALGDRSLTRLLPITKNIVLCLDNDKAGQKAGERINAQFMEKGITPLFIDLGEHKDPDDFLNAEGRNALAKRLEDAKPFIDIQLERMLPGEIPELAERKLELLNQIFEVLSPLKDSLSATERAVSWAKKLGLHSDSSTIIRNYSEYLKGHKPQQLQASPPVAPTMDIDGPPPGWNEENPFAGEIYEERVEIERRITAVETRLLQNLVQHPELLLLDETAELLDFVGNDEVKGYILRLRELMYEIDESEYPSIVNSLMSDEQYSAEVIAIAGGALYKYRETSLNEKVAQKMIEDIKKKLQIEQLLEEKKLLKQKHLSAQNKEEQMEALTQLMEIDKKLAQVRRGPNTKV